MQFVINTSLEPFGCALLEDDKILDISLWEDFRKVGEASWEFLEKHKDHWNKIDHIGGISGPGGFSNLRVAGVILNALSLRLDLLIHQVRAEKIVSYMLQKQGIETPFLLNSFSDAIFEVEGEDLIRIPISEAIKKYKGIDVCVDFLPESKSEVFDVPVALNLDSFYLDMGEVLKETEEQSVFVPDYEYPAVQ